MQDNLEKINILFILSRLYLNELTLDKINIEDYLRNFNDSRIKIDVLIDPTRNELEDCLYIKNYFCVLTCSTHSVRTLDENKWIMHRYNILKLLETLGIKYFGINYCKSLIFKDEITYLHMSNHAIDGKIFTKYQFEKEKSVSDLKNYFPAYLKAIYSQNIFSSAFHKIESFEEGEQWITNIFLGNETVDEVLIQKEVSFDKKYSIIIIGNSPQTLEIVYEIKNNNELELITTLSEYHISQILSLSYELFEKYELKDFAQFSYLFNEKEQKYYLTEINTQNVLNSNVVKTIMQKYKISFNEYIYLLLIPMIETDSMELLGYLVKKLPFEITNNLLSLDTKIQLFPNYDYKDVCKELKGRILKQDESNKYEIIKLMKSTFEHLPKPNTSESLYLGNSDFDYPFLKKYEEIPFHPQNPQKILNISAQILNGQMRWHSSSILYNVDPSIMFNTIVASAITNLYNPSTMVEQYCAGYLKMENQIITQLSSLIGWKSSEASGVFTPGGKICLSYAIKAGLNRCLHFSKSKKKPVVICSEINHFSIEAVCDQLGIQKEFCLRVPVDQSGTIDFQKFGELLNKLLREDVPIACIIFSGGNTTHCTVENIQQGVDILKNITANCKTAYIPYVYYDLVICWPWLFFKKYDFNKNPLNIENTVLQKIERVKNIISYSYLADGVGIDFHKCGFAPLTNSIFLIKKAEELYSMTNTFVKENQREPYHYTFSNSRGATDIISAWNILQSVGVEGFQAYVANMMTVAGIFESQLPKFGFEVVYPNNTYGFATILWASPPKHNYSLSECTCKGADIIYENNKYLYHLTEYLKQNPDSGYAIRFLPNYTDIATGCKIAVVVILPMTLHIDKDNAIKISNKIGNIKRQFDKGYQDISNLVFDTMPDEIPK